MTITTTTQRSFVRPNRTLLLLGVAGVIFVGALGYRLWTELTRAAAPVNPPAAIASASKEASEQFQMRIQRNPNDVEAYAALGLTLLQQVRETGDTTLYTRSQQALDEAIKRDPKNVDALLGQGVLSLAMHNFAEALPWADKAWALNPYKAETLGIKVDGLVELGRYDEAVETLQQMVDLRPDLSSYSRISYLRELNGDVEGAIEAMNMAVQSTPIGTESWLWTLTHLGHLYFNKGDLTNAEQIYQQVLHVRNDYPYAQAGIAKVQAGNDQIDQAIATLKPISERLPLPEFLTQLGELYQLKGDDKAAHEQYDLVGVIQQLNAGAGMNVDLEMALFNANHGALIGVDAAATVEQARAAYAVRPTIYGADALAWALYKANSFEEAKKYSTESLKLGTKDATLYYHAGMIANALGDQSAAQTYLKTALTINPYFSVLYAPEVKTMVNR